MNADYQYDVAISFAEEDRNVALALALALELKGVRRVYYYHDQPAATAGKVLLEELRAIYSRKARYAIILLSEKYFTKSIAQAEMQAIYERIQNRPDLQCVILVKLSTSIKLEQYPLFDRLSYVVWNFQPKEIADIIIANLGKEATPEKEGKNLETIFQTIHKTVHATQSNTATNADTQTNTANFNF